MEFYVEMLAGGIHLSVWHVYLNKVLCSLGSFLSYQQRGRGWLLSSSSKFCIGRSHITFRNMHQGEVNFKMLCLNGDISLTYPSAKHVDFLERPLALYLLDKQRKSGWMLFTTLATKIVLFWALKRNLKYRCFPVLTLFIRLDHIYTTYLYLKKNSVTICYVIFILIFFIFSKLIWMYI